MINKKNNTLNFLEKMYILAKKGNNFRKRKEISKDERESEK